MLDMSKIIDEASQKLSEETQPETWYSGSREKLKLCIEDIKDILHSSLEKWAKECQDEYEERLNFSPSCPIMPASDVIRENQKAHHLLCKKALIEGVQKSLKNVQ